jgi:carboxyl-terminal processing protease
MGRLGRSVAAFVLAVGFSATATALSAEDATKPPAAKSAVKPAASEKPAGTPTPGDGSPAAPKPEKRDPGSPTDPRDDVYELQRMLADTIDQVERNYVRKVDRRRLVEAAIKGILTELDQHSAYISPEEMDRFRTTVEAGYGGVGIQLNRTADGQLRVISPMVNSPAYRAGILKGDRIVEIDGRNVEKIGVDEAVKLVKGKPGTRITITVVRARGNAKETVELTRENIHVETVLGQHRKADDAWDYVLDPQRRIGYVRLTSFTRDTAADLKKVLTQLKRDKVAGLVLDLRFNPGGLLGAAIEVCDMFVSQGRIVTVSGRNTPSRSWDAHKEGTFEGFPVVVLVNRYSASASEIVAACLQDHKRAIVLGERTWGKGSVQNVVMLNEGKPGTDTSEGVGALKLTTAGYQRPSGKNIDRGPRAKDTDEWGVSPNPGFELKLSDEELEALQIDWRKHEMVAGKPSGAKPAAASPAKTEADAAATNDATDHDYASDKQLTKAVDYLSNELARAK